jgi:hypothetical protein
MTAQLREWLETYQHGQDKRLGPALLALRAVVELHQPIPEFVPEPGEVAHCKECEWIWPCPTIRTIEKVVLP